MTRTSGWLANAAPAAPAPVTRFNTPGGRPASSNTLTNAALVAGVSSLGLKTIVLPAIKAGNIFQLGTAIGKFQGVIRPMTPTESRIAMPNLFGISTGAV